MSRLSPEQADALRNEIGVTQERLETGPSGPGVIPIVIKCTWSSCRHGRHTLDHSRRRGVDVAKAKPGHCLACGAEVVAMPQPGSNAVAASPPLGGVINDLQKELIRAHYWNVPIDLKAYNKALRYGRDRLHERLESEVRKALLEPGFQGRRAAYSGDIVGYAMHATASCCRRCASYWYGLPRDITEQPDPAAVDYIVGVARTYIDLRLPELPRDPSDVPGVSHALLPNADEIDRLDHLLVDQLHRDLDPAGLVRAERSAIVLGHQVDMDGGYVMFNQLPLHNLGAA